MLFLCLCNLTYKTATRLLRITAFSKRRDILLVSIFTLGLTNYKTAIGLLCLGALSSEGERNLKLGVAFYMEMEYTIKHV